MTERSRKSLSLPVLHIMLALAEGAKHGYAIKQQVEARTDGSHLAELWARRQPFYPTGDIDLLQRFIVGAFIAGALKG